MSSFTLPLEVKPVEGSDTLWELITPFEYDIGNVGSGLKVIVPAGYQTDFASIPKILWSILPPWGRYGKAAVIHDYLCSYRRAVNEHGESMPISRKFADSVFLEAMQVLGVGVVTRYSMYWAVRGYAIFNRIR